MSNISKKKANTSPRTRRNVINLDPERIKKSDEYKWAKRFLEFLDSLSEAEFELVQNTVNLISDRPSKRTKPREVIQFDSTV